MYAGSNGARRVHILKNGFLRRASQQCFGNASKRAKAMYA
jgi:hypothetical protein